MKFLILCLTLLISNNLFAGNCSTDPGYRESGWTIIYPTNFNQIYKTLKKELDNGDYRVDLDGQIVTSQTPNESRIYMRTQTWDNVTTPMDEMYGDIGIFTNKQNPEEVLELRWYKDGTKYIAVNSTYLTCISIHVPTAVNVIF